jgi:hypothetical protein
VIVGMAVAIKAASSSCRSNTRPGDDEGSSGFVIIECYGALLLIARSPVLTPNYKIQLGEVLCRVIGIWKERGS